MTAKNCLKLTVNLGIALCAGLLCAGCYNAKTVTGYPVDMINGEEEETDTDTVEEENVNTYEEEIPEFMPNDSPFNQHGEFVYNPVALRPGISNYYSTEEDILYMAKQILETVNGSEKEMTLSFGHPVDKEDFDEAMEIALMSNPLVYNAVFETTDYLAFTIKYPDYFGALDEYGAFEPEKYVEDDTDISAEIDEFRDFIEDTINDNVSFDDTDMEKAYKIYKYLIENYNIADDDFAYYETDIDPNFKSVLHIDVLRHLRNDRLYLHEILKLYQFMLTQLNIKTMYCGLSGKLVDQSYLKISSDNPYWKNVDALIIEIDNVDYLCNMYFDYLDYKFFPISENDNEAACNNFAASKATINKTFLIDNVAYYIDMEPDILEWDDLSTDYPKDLL